MAAADHESEASTATAAAVVSPLIFECVNCSNSRSLAYYSCVECNSSSSSAAFSFSLSLADSAADALDGSAAPHNSNPLCHACARQFHQPTKYRHHLLVNLTPHRFPSHYPALPDIPIPSSGRGFCSRCRLNLGELECDTCIRAFCFECDSVFHSAIDEPHSRVFFEFPMIYEEFPVRVAGRRVNFRCAKGLAAYSGVIWAGSQLLASYLESSAMDSFPWSSSCVLELGCGCAPLPALAAAIKFGSKLVIATDGQEEAIKLASENVSRLSLSAAENRRFLARVYSFGSPISSVSDENSFSFDLVLASYILYNPDVFPLLISTLTQIFSRNPLCVALFTSHDHQRDQQFVQLLTQNGLISFTVEFIEFQPANAETEEEDENSSTNPISGNIIKITRTMKE